MFFQDLCIQVPILKFPDEGFSACGREDKTATTEDSWAQFEDFEDFDEEFENFGANDTGDGIFAPLLGIKEVSTLSSLSPRIYTFFFMFVLPNILQRTLIILCLSLQTLDKTLILIMELMKYARLEKNAFSMCSVHLIIQTLINILHGK